MLESGLHGYHNLSTCFTRLSGNNLLLSLLITLPQNDFLHTEPTFGDNDVITIEIPTLSSPLPLPSPHWYGKNKIFIFIMSSS